MLSFIAGLLIGILVFGIVQCIALLNKPDDCVVIYVVFGWIIIAVTEDGYEYGFSTENPID